MFHTRRAASWASATILTLILSGCSPQEPPAPALRTADISGASSVEPGPSSADTLYGSFLVGWSAYRNGNVYKAADYFERALKIDPESEALRERQFGALLAAGRIEEALELAPSVSESGYFWIPARTALAVAAFRRGDTKSADGFISQIPSEAPSGTIKSLLQAWLQVEQEEYDRALATINGLRDGVLDPFLDLHSGFVTEIAGRPDEARAHYEKGTGIGSTRAALGLGRLHERTEGGEKARSFYTEFLARYPGVETVERELQLIGERDAPPPIVRNAADGVAETLLALAGAAVGRGDATVQLMFFQLAIWLRPDLDDARIRIAEYMERRGLFEMALASYRELPEDSPYRTTARLSIALQLERLKRFDEAVVALSELADAEPRKYRPLTSLADLYRRKKDYEKAVEVYDRAFEVIGRLSGEHWWTLYTRGMALERLGRWEQAEKDFEKALEFRPDQPDILNYLGYSWVDMGINLDKALGMIERAVQARPNSGYIVDSLGWAHYRLGNYRDAVKHLERAVELMPLDPVVNDHLGDAYWRVGRRIEAGFQWKRALTMDPEDKVRKSIEQKLRTGLKDMPANSGTGQGTSR